MSFFAGRRYPCQQRNMIVVLFKIQESNISLIISRIIIIIMNAIYLNILLILLIKLALTANPNSPCFMPFVQTGWLVVDTTPYYNHPEIGYIYAALTIPLITAQNDANYIATVIFGDFFFLLNQAIMDCETFLNSKTMSSIIFYYYIEPSKNLKKLSFRYLAVPSSFQEIKAVEWVGYFSGIINSQTSVTSNYGSIPASNLVGGYHIIALVQGFRINQFDSTNSIGFKVEAILTSPYNLQIIITNIGDKPITIEQFYLFVLWYNNGEISLRFPNFNIQSGSFSNTQVYSNSHILEISSFYGISQFSTSNQSALSYSLSTSAPKIIFSSTSLHFYTVSFVFFWQGRTPYNCCYSQMYYMQQSNQCMNSCLDGFYNNNATYLCQKCPNLCLVCNAVRCLKCLYGFSTNGGCSNVTNCVMANSTSYDLNNNCISCLNNFVLNTVTKSCQCSSGLWEVTNWCVDYVGCISVSKTGNRLVCNGCDLRFLFVLSNGVCICTRGYYYNKITGKCQQWCGDGLLVKHQCDDGNLANGDGCSSSCKVENKFKCLGGSLMTTSYCIYQGKDLVLSLLQVNKVDGQNQGLFTFKINPQYSFFQNRHLLQDLKFSCLQNISNVEWTEKAGLIQVYVDYKQSLQGNPATVNITFDNNIIALVMLNVSFSMISAGAKLIIIKKQSQIKQFRQFMFIISLVITFLFFIFSFGHKMLGVQIINTMQVIYFTSQLSTKSTEPYSIFSEMSYINLNMKYLTNPLNNYYQSGVSDFSYENEIFSKKIIFCLLLFPLLYMAFQFILINLVQVKQHKKEIISRIGRYVYHIVAFPVSIGFLFQGALETSSTNAINLNRAFLDVLIQLILSFVILFIFFYEWKQLLTSNQASLEDYYGLYNCKDQYIPVYLTYIYLLLITLLLQNWKIIQYFLPISFAMTCIFLLWFLAKRPYRFTIHNFGQILNLLLILSFIGWTYLREINYRSILDQQSQILILFLFCLGIISCISVTTVRFVASIKEKCAKKQVQPRQKKHFKNDSIQDKQQQQLCFEKYDLNKYNKYLLSVSTMQSKLNDWRETNAQRRKNNSAALHYGVVNIIQDSLIDESFLLKKNEKKQSGQDLKKLKNLIREKYYLNKLDD